MEEYKASPNSVGTLPAISLEACTESTLPLTPMAPLLSQGPMRWAISLNSPTGANFRLFPDDASTSTAATSQGPSIDVARGPRGFNVLFGPDGEISINRTPPSS